MTGSQSYFEKYYKPYLNGAKQCFDYQECGYKSITPFQYNNEQKFTTYMDKYSLKKNRFAFFMPDGTFYWFIVAGSTSTGGLVPNDTVYIDINGGKEPNIIGKDIFVFRRVTGKGILPSGYNTRNAVTNDWCLKTGEYCAAKIMRDGWKITYPY